MNEGWPRWPPEYYTKTWPCTRVNSCAQTWSHQTKWLPPVDEWYPDWLETGWDSDYEWEWFDCFNTNNKLFDHAGGSLYLVRLKVEVWEEDSWGRDDFVDRCMDPTPTPQAGWVVWQSNGVYGDCKIKIKRKIW